MQPETYRKVIHINKGGCWGVRVVIITLPKSCGEFALYEPPSLESYDEYDSLWRAA